MELYETYLFTYSGQQYEGIVLEKDVELKSGLAYRIFAKKVDAPNQFPFTLACFHENLCVNIEHIENLHFFNVDEMIELFMSMNGILKFVGYDRDFNWGAGTLLANNNVHAVDYLYFSHNGQFIEMAVPYDHGDATRSPWFDYYFIHIIPAHEMAELERGEFFRKVGDIIYPCKLTESNSGDVLSRAKFFNVSSNPVGIRFGNYCIWDTATDEDREVLDNGFRDLTLERYD